MQGTHEDVSSETKSKGDYMITTEDIKRVVQGGLDRLDKPTECKEYLWAELHSLNLTANHDDKNINAIVRLINKIVGRGG